MAHKRTAEALERDIAEANDKAQAAQAAGDSEAAQEWTQRAVLLNSQLMRERLDGPLTGLDTES